MRRILTAIVLSFMFIAPAGAANLELAWNANTEPDLAGYIVYYGASSRNYTDWVDVGYVTSARITGLGDDTEYFFALAAYDYYGNDSDFSDEVSGYPIPDPISDGASSGEGCFITRAH